MGPSSAVAANRPLEILCVIFLLAFAQSARCAPMVAHWSAYLRAEPSESAAVIDEIRHGARLDVDHCAGDWCLVRNGAQSGWIDKDALTLAAPPVGGASTQPADCAWAGQAAAHAPEPTQFCHTKSPGG